MPRSLSSPAELIGWELEDIQVRLRPLARPMGICTMSYRFKSSMGEFKTQGQPLHWVHRTDNAWYLIRPPRDK